MPLIFLSPVARCKTSKQPPSSVAVSATDMEDNPDSPVDVNASAVEDSLFDGKLNDG